MKKTVLYVLHFAFLLSIFSLTVCSESSPLPEESLISSSQLSLSSCYQDCNDHYGSCLISYPVPVRFVCDITRQICLERCGVDTTLPAVPTVTFYGVGDGRGDGSSDVFSFSYDTATNRIFDYDKIGEAGLTLYDIALDNIGTFYGVDRFGGLHQISLADGHASFVGSNDSYVNSLEFCGTTLYGWNSNSLFTIDRASGSATLFSSVGYESSGDLGCSLYNILYGIAKEPGSDTLVKFSLFSGSATKIGSLGYSNVYGFVVDQSDKLYGALSSGPSLILLLIDPTTGAVTKTATYPSNAGVHGLTTYKVAF